MDSVVGLKQVGKEQLGKFCPKPREKFITSYSESWSLVVAARYKI